MVYVETDEVTIDQLNEWDNSVTWTRAIWLDTNHPKVRIENGQFDPAKPNNHNVVGGTWGKSDFAGRKFIFNYWTEEGPTQIQELMEHNLLTGEVLPWKD